MDIDVWQPPPPPPEHPLVDGVYTFAFHPANFRALAALFAAFFIEALVLVGFRALIELLDSLPEGSEMSLGGGMVYRGARYVFACLCVFGVLACICPAAHFMRTIEESAAGTVEIDWRVDVYFEWVFKFVHLLWVVFCCGFVASLLLFALVVFTPVPAVYWWLMVLFVASLLAPIALFSTLSAGSAWMVFEPRIVGRMCQKPVELAYLYGNLLLFVGLSVALGIWMVRNQQWGVTPIAGVIWAASSLTLGRVFGRVGWVLTQDDRKKRRKKRKRPRRVEKE